MEHFDTLIIGGGAAGLMAAIQAGSLGQKVAIAEKNHSVGEKILLSGKGRCNFSNAESDFNIFLSKYVRGGDFLRTALKKFSPLDVRNFFYKIGVPFVEERGKRIFPSSGDAQKVVAALVARCKKFNVKILRSTPVKGLRVKNNFIQAVITDKDELIANKYILATGGKSFPKTGSTGDGYFFAEQAGHSITNLYPALVPVKIKQTWVKLASGCNLKNIRLDVYLDGEKIATRFGEMEFTNFGISGPVVMDLSSYIPDWEGEIFFSLDLKPALTQDVLIRRIKRDIQEKYQGKKFRALLRGLIPAGIMNLMIELIDIPPDKKVEYLSDEELINISNGLKNIRLDFSGLFGYNHAIVTRGGVNLDEVEAETMRSKLCKNLYFAGEILDINGLSGGFNLQACWSTGYLAGLS